MATNSFIKKNNMKFKVITIHDVALPANFVSFLKENNAYGKYIHNLNTIKSKNFNKEIQNRDLIICAFKWILTNEGDKFWRDIHYKWKHT